MSYLALCFSTYLEGCDRLIYFHDRRSLSVKGRLQIRVVALKASDIGIVVGLSVLAHTCAVFNSDWRFEIDWFAFTTASCLALRTDCKLELSL